MKLVLKTIQCGDGKSQVALVILLNTERMPNLSLYGFTNKSEILSFEHRHNLVQSGVSENDYLAIYISIPKAAAKKSDTTTDVSSGRAISW